MFNSGNSGIPFTMNVEPSGSTNGGNNGGWGDMGAWWIVIFVLFFAFGGWGNGGWGNGNNGGGSNGSGSVMDAYVLNSDFATLQRQLDSGFAGVTSGITQVNNGLCNGFYQQAQLVNGVQMQIANEARGTDNAICNLGTAMQQGNFALQQAINADTVANMQNTNAISTQIADCCCKNQTGQMQLANAIESGLCTVNYNSATNTNAIMQSAHNDTDRIIARLDAMESARKDETIADLRTKLAACGDQTTAQYIINQLTGIISPRAVPAYPAASPCGLGNWSAQVLANGYGNCGCNTGCC